jgi:L-alanine-DL-glutamate epimerase-like enolase superfamily enzyme
MKMTITPLTLRTKHEFKIARGGNTNWQHLVVRLEHDGRTGLGEVAATAYYGESAATARAALAAWEPLLPTDPWEVEGFEARAGARLAQNRAAWCALDTALWDLRGQIAGLPLWKLWGLEREAMPLSSFTLGLADWETMEVKLSEAAPYPILKVKVGGADDLRTLARIRERTERPIRVDANAGWTRAEALAILPRLADLGVEFVEQPLDPADHEGLRWLCARSPLPIFVDESCHVASDVPRFAGSAAGVVVKLAKTGGPTEALRLFHTARAHGLGTMIGCMIESSLGITAAAHLGPLADTLDLDGHWLLAEDPFRGVGGEAGRLVLPERPGLGVVPREGVPAHQGG